MKFLPSRQPSRDLSPKSHRLSLRRAAAGSQDFSCELPGRDHYRSIRRGIPAYLANRGGLKHFRRWLLTRAEPRLYDRATERLKMK
jgi:hypothetical protein